jgi:exodeoxyribonuclease V alpha subunit
MEADLVARLASRGGSQASPAELAGTDGLDAGQQVAIAALTGDAWLVVVEGAAGAGKTTVLAATRDHLEQQRRRLVVLTPTMKAAQVASVELGTRAGSAAWLAYQHGWRWDDAGRWARLAVGDVDPVTGRVYQGPRGDAQLRGGDLLLVDEAGMLDQDTAHALLTIADEHGARVALVGDRRQLPAVGRGGVLDLAHRWADASARVDLDTVHRFVRTVGGASVPDAEYAALTLAMRAGEDPAAAFDALHGRGQIKLHGSEGERRDVLAGEIAAARLSGRSTAVVVDTCEHAATLNAATRDRLVAAGFVDDHATAVTGDGQRIGAGDVIVTRRNDPTFGVANRESWTVTRAHRDGRLAVSNNDRGVRELPAGYVRDHVELGYATTAYGAQGDTTDQAHLVTTDTTTARAAYVAMTRGCASNTAHLVAADLDQAREQWISAFSRDHADLGPAAASQAAAHASAGYTPAARAEDPGHPAGVLDQLRGAWTEQLVAHRQLQHLKQQLKVIQDQAAWEAHSASILAPLEAARDAAWAAAQRADHAADGCAARLAERAEQHATELRQAWDAQLPAADRAAHTIAAGPGRLGVHRGRARDAVQHLGTWTAAWAPVFADSDVDPHQLAARPIAFPSNVERIADALYQHARRLAAADYPDQAARLGAARVANNRYEAAATTYQHARRELRQVSRRAVYDTGAADLVPDLTDKVHTAQQRVTAADQHVATLSASVAITTQPDPERLLDAARAAWHADRVAAYQRATFGRSGPWRPISHEREPYPAQQIDHGPGIGR